jgi:hypothetical protein
MKIEPILTPAGAEQRCTRYGYGQRRRRSGFSLGEMLAAVIIGAMILTALLGVYGRANQAADAILRKIEGPSRAAEVLQLIAEDLDRTLGAEGVSIQIRNGFDSGFVRAELVLRRTFHDKENKEQTLEEITWRAAYDHGGEVPGLLLYRSYEGVGREDKLLDDQRDSWEKNYPFVPICRGVTFFQVQAYKGDDLVEQWATSSPLPPGIKVTISFTEPYETVRGTWDVLDQEKTSRTVVVDATRKIKFTVPATPDASEVEEPKESPDEQAPEERTTEPRSPSRRGSRERVTNEPTRTRGQTRPR